MGAAIITGVAPLLGFQAPAAVRTVAQFNALHNKANKALSLFNKAKGTNYTLEGLYADMKTKTAEKRKTEKAEQDLYESFADTPNHPERIALQAELEIGKKHPTDVQERDGATQETNIKIENIEEVNDAKTQLLRKYQEMNEASRLAWQRQQQMNRDKQMAYYRMMMKPYFTGAAQGGRVPQGYNTGGLSNLFKLKNV